MKLKKATYDKARVMRDAKKRYEDGQRLDMGWTYARCLRTAWQAEAIRQKMKEQENATPQTMLFL